LHTPDFLLQISDKAKEKGYTLFFYGGFPEAPDKIEEFIKSQFDGINIVSEYSPLFKVLTAEENDAI